MSDNEFIHLKIRSAYSLLDGAMPVKKIVPLAKERQLAALGICDPNMFGSLEYSEGLAGAGIQPIIGLCVNVNIRFDEEHYINGLIALYAQNETGLNNLMLISSASFLETEDTEDGSLPIDRVLEMSEGLICLSGGWQSIANKLLFDAKKEYANQWLNKLKNAFPNRFYIEIQRHGRVDEAASEAGLIDFAYENDIPLVGTNDVRYDKREKAPSHEILTCIGTGEKIGDPNRVKLTEEHYFKTSDEMKALFHDLPECIENTVEIAKRCAIRVKKRKPILPSFPSDDGLSEDDELFAQARAGLEYRLKTRPPVAPIQDYNDRLEFELNIIKGMGFSGYFLIVSDFIKWAKKNNIPVGPGRGSGAGSLVAYVMQITNLDPLEFGLLFERFLNPERISMPDFDIDFCQDRRGEVITYVQSKYGFDRVSQIITFGTLQARAAVRDVGRVLNMSYGRVNDITKLIPNNPANPVPLKKAIETEEKLQEAYQDEEVKYLLDTALELEGLYRNCSTHAAGVVIAGRVIKELVPLYKDPKSDIPATQYNMKWSEQAGLVKFDFLGLKTLTVIQNAINLLRERGVEVDFDKHRYDDKEVFDYLSTGQTLGVFQLEGQGMRDTLKRMLPTCLADIIALISLYRPGPMENIPLYCDVKAGKQPPDYLHPSLEPVLKETHGVIIYQEQVMKIAQILSGYSLGEADMLRRAMGKKLQSEMDLQRIRFVEGASKNNVDSELSGQIFDLVNKFAGYGFNKSHAAAYAVVSYQTAWLKTKYPAEFLVAAMNLDIEDTTKLGAYVQEAKRLKIKVNKPDINSSGSIFTIKDGEIYYALGAIKNIGTKAMSDVENERKQNGPFKDLYDFFERVGPKSLNKRAVENLAKAGAFESVEKNRALVCEAAETLMAHSTATYNDSESSQASLFGSSAKPPRSPLPKVKDWAEQEKLTQEFNALGIFISGHPLDDMYNELMQRKTIFYGLITESMKASDSVFRMAGVVRAIKERPAKKGGKFAWVTFSDPTAEFEVFVAPEELSASRDLIVAGKAVTFVATARASDGDLRITASKFDEVEKIASTGCNGVKIILENDFRPEDIKDFIEQLRGMESRNFGSIRLVVPIDNNREVEMTISGNLPMDINARRAIKSAYGVKSIIEM